MGRLGGPLFSGVYFPSIGLFRSIGLNSMTLCPGNIFLAPLQGSVKSVGYSSRAVSLGCSAVGLVLGGGVSVGHGVNLQSKFVTHSGKRNYTSKSSVWSKRAKIGGI